MGLGLGIVDWVDRLEPVEVQTVDLAEGSPGRVVEFLVAR